mmetsp:Transcript_3898/g.11463  ORF Transcript_3898/g.11463 Transcript_3898/m.11463 type:complete len:212 (-) Transcript_3898:15-650(-)
MAGALLVGRGVDAPVKCGALLQAKLLQDRRTPGAALLDLQHLVVDALILAAVLGLRAPVAVAAPGHGVPHEALEGVLDVVVRPRCQLRDPRKPSGQHSCEGVPDQLHLREALVAVEGLDLRVVAAPPDDVQQQRDALVLLGAAPALLGCADHLSPPAPAVLVRHAEQEGLCRQRAARLQENGRLANAVAVVAPRRIVDALWEPICFRDPQR